MRDFCSLSDLEAETALVNRSVTEAAKFSIKAKNQRLYPDVENLLMEKCKGKKSRLNALLTYCGHWGLVPDNMTEITIIAGFEGGRRGDLGKEFMRKLAANKKHCRELLEQIMKMDGISENEPITKIMERLA
jgi:hypothetical protein